MRILPPLEPHFSSLTIPLSSDSLPPTSHKALTGQRGPTEEGEDKPALSSSNVQSALAEKGAKFLFPPCLSFNSYLHDCHSPVSCLSLGDRIAREGVQGHGFSPSVQIWDSDSEPE